MAVPLHLLAAEAWDDNGRSGAQAQGGEGGWERGEGVIFSCISCNST